MPVRDGEGFGEEPAVHGSQVRGRLHEPGPEARIRFDDRGQSLVDADREDGGALRESLFVLERPTEVHGVRDGWLEHSSTGTRRDQQVEPGAVSGRAHQSLPAAQDEHAGGTVGEERLHEARFASTFVVAIGLLLGEWETRHEVIHRRIHPRSPRGPAGVALTQPRPCLLTWTYG
ncbi:hypothetical protein ACFPRL_29695 [Pseudoclavibacter helvolus]